MFEQLAFETCLAHRARRGQCLRAAPALPDAPAAAVSRSRPGSIPLVTPAVTFRFTWGVRRLVPRAIVGITIVARPVQALIGLGIVATGVPAYFVWQVQAEALKHLRS